MLRRLPYSLPTLTLLLVGLLTLAYFFLTHAGIYDYDDYTYASYAYQLQTGTFDPAPPLGDPDHNPLHGRWLVFGPVAVLYTLFGVNAFSSTLWPLLCTLGASGLCYLLYRHRAPLAASVALLLLGLHYFHLNLSNYLYPDNVLLFFALASAATLLRGRQAPLKKAGWWGASFALLNFAALLSKETIVYYLPFYLFLLGRDVVRHQHRRFWLVALTTGALLLGGYCTYYYWLAHDPFFPWRVVEHTNEEFKGRSYAGGHRDVLARITWQPLALIIGSGLAPALLLTLVAVRRWTHLPREAHFWLTLTATAWLFYWVGSTSLVYYNPNSLVPRMLAPLLPPLCLGAGFGAQHLLQTGRDYSWVGLGLLLSAAWLHNSISPVYGLLGMGFLGLALLAANGLTTPPLRVRVTILLIGLGLSIRPLYFMAKTNFSDFAPQQHLLLHELRGPTGVVYVDDFLLRYHAFSYGFQVPAGLRFRSYASADSVSTRPGEPRWLLLNRRTLVNPELRPHLISYSATEVLAKFPRRQLIAQQDSVELYVLDAFRPGT